MNVKLLLCFFAAFLIACSGPELDTKKTTSKTAIPELSAAEKATLEANQVKKEVINDVLKGLKDPDSAKFGEFTRVSEDSACLGINARNSYGGYTGEQQALLFKLEGKWEIIKTEKIDHGFCVDMMGKFIKKRAETTSSTRSEQSSTAQQ